MSGKPSVLIPNFRDRQLEVFAKSVQAAIDQLHQSSTNVQVVVQQLQGVSSSAQPSGGSGGGSAPSAVRNRDNFTFFQP